MLVPVSYRAKRPLMHCTYQQAIASTMNLHMNQHGLPGLLQFRSDFYGPKVYGDDKIRFWRRRGPSRFPPLVLLELREARKAAQAPGLAAASTCYDRFCMFLSASRVPRHADATHHDHSRLRGERSDPVCKTNEGRGAVPWMRKASSRRTAML